MSCFLFLSYWVCWIRFTSTVVWGGMGLRKVGGWVAVVSHWCFYLKVTGEGAWVGCVFGCDCAWRGVRPVSAMPELLFPCWFSCASSTCGGGFTTLDVVLVFFFPLVLDNLFSQFLFLFFYSFPSSPPLLAMDFEEPTVTLEWDYCCFQSYICIAPEAKRTLGTRGCNWAWGPALQMWTQTRLSNVGAERVSLVSLAASPSPFPLRSLPVWVAGRWCWWMWSDSRSPRVPPARPAAQPRPPGPPLLRTWVLLAQTPPKAPKPTWCGAVAHGKAEELVGLQGCAAGVEVLRAVEQFSSNN